VKDRGDVRPTHEPLLCRDEFTPGCLLRANVTEIARRPSLVDAAVGILRRDLQSGIWREYLPGEHRLCERLQISRPTLRHALEMLRREGLIEVSQGRRRRITPQG